MKQKLVAVLLVLMLLANIGLAAAQTPLVKTETEQSTEQTATETLTTTETEVGTSNTSGADDLANELVSTELNKIEMIIHRAEHRHAELEEKIAALEREGVDVTELRELLKEHKEKIDLARAKILEAKEKFKAGEIEAGLELIKEAKDLMDDGYELASEITALCAKASEKAEEHKYEMREREKEKEREHRFGNETEHEEEHGMAERERAHENESEEMGKGVGMGAHGMKMGKEAREMVKEEYKEAKERYKKAREEFERAKKMGLDIREERGFKMAKGFMVAGLDVAEMWLERLKVQVMNMGEEAKITEETKLELLAKIDEKLAEIKELKNEINETSSPEELIETVKKIRKEWREIRDEMRALTGYVAVAKVEKLVEKAKQVELMLEAKIEELDAAGVDTTKLEATLEDFSAKVNEAEDLIDKAENLFEEGNIAEGHMTLKEAIKTLKEAFKDVKEVVSEMKEMNQYRVREGKIFYGNETGEVWVDGNGTAEFNGTGIVVIRGNATLEVAPEDAIVTLVGFGVKSVEGGVSRVSGEGKAVIRGENLTVKVEGDDFKLIVKGYGTLKLDGEGEYRVKKSPQEEMSEEIEYAGLTTIEFGGEQ